MNNIIKVVGIFFLVLASCSANAQTTNAEKAGMCAGNAMVIKDVAKAGNLPSLYQKALDQQNYFYNKYGQQAGFAQAMTWQFNQKNLSGDQRLKIADGCGSSGL